MRVSVLMLFPLWLYGASLSTLIENAKATHLSLRNIEHKLSAVDAQYEASRNFANPELALSVNDIHLQDISNRSIEPMQSSAINLKQKIPYFGKRDALSNKVEIKKEQVFLSLQDAKVKLVQNIKTIAYTIWQIEEKIQIINRYIQLTDQTIDINTAYSSSDTKYTMGVISAQLNLSQLKIKKHKYESIRQGLYKKISYLSAMDVDSLELSMEMEAPKSIEYYQSASHNNLSYKRKEAEVAEAGADLKIKELAAYIDPVVQLGYYHRESFQDYMSIGMSFSLPIYGTEKLQEESSKKLLLAHESETNDFQNSLSAEIENIYAQLQYRYEEYAIINNDALPELEHMFDLASGSIQSGADLFVYIELLQKKLALDEQSINAVAEYYKTQASLEAMIGVMQ